MTRATLPLRRSDGMTRNVPSILRFGLYLFPGEHIEEGTPAARTVSSHTWPSPRRAIWCQREKPQQIADELRGLIVSGELVRRYLSRA